ncbi:MAG: N-acetylneuraminate synthase [Thaumarchaeota archaeon]|jgi:sialic acid synthase SpsE|nr:MAG: N-acetylneuraminate synthase [Nitrososphaerota archaeon]
MTKIKINKFLIGHDCNPFIVAEVGINHNGEIKKAFEMIEIAKKTGLDAIKFQTFKASEFIADTNQTYTYKSQGKEITESMYDMFTRYEFSNKDWIKIKKKCDQEEILFLSSPQNYSDLELLLNLNIKAIKIGSDDLTNLPLLKKFSSTNLPIILSTGMSTIDEVSDALDAVGFFSGYPTILLVTTSQYPTPSKDVNLMKFHTLSKQFPNLPLGFSDHTVGPLASSLACVLGATFFEKHFTLDHNLPGPDHSFSIDPQELKIWRDSIINSFEMLGNPNIKPTKEEEKMKIIARRSICAIQDIKKGEIFTPKNLGIRRPGNGLKPIEIEKIFGTKAVKNIINGRVLEKGDYENGF